MSNETSPDPMKEAETIPVEKPSNPNETYSYEETLSISNEAIQSIQNENQSRSYLIQ
ncbi:MAG: hypothetical protein H7122_18685 [Chitinophagaceae bacterium]|nr:hypothetical protein [Chitinophagaceae bacterium]